MVIKLPFPDRHRFQNSAIAEGERDKRAHYNSFKEDHCNNPAHPCQWPSGVSIVPLAFEVYGAASEEFKDQLNIAASSYESRAVDTGWDDSAAGTFRSKHAHRISTVLAIGVAAQLYGVAKRVQFRGEGVKFGKAVVPHAQALEEEAQVRRLGLVPSQLIVPPQMSVPRGPSRSALRRLVRQAVTQRARQQKGCKLRRAQSLPAESRVLSDVRVERREDPPPTGEGGW